MRGARISDVGLERHNIPRYTDIAVLLGISLYCPSPDIDPAVIDRAAPLRSGCPLDVVLYWVAVPSAQRPSTPSEAVMPASKAS